MTYGGSMAEKPAHPAEEAPARPPVDWSRPTFTAHLRGHGAGVPPFAAREHRLAHKSSAAFAVVRAVARVPGLRRLAGAVPPAIGADAGSPDGDALLHSRLYQRLDGLRYTPIYRTVWTDRLRPLVRPATAGARAASSADGDALPAAPDAASSPLGPWVSRSVDEAIDVLRSVPFEEVQRRGWHFQPNHFYWPLNDVAFLRENMALWHDRGAPKGIDWRLDAQVEVARAVHRYLPELDDVPEVPDDGPARFVWQNNAFSGADAVVYYGLVRERQPRRVVEIGSGWSNLLLARALERNDTPCQVTLVEPFPNESLFASLPHDWELHRAIVQHADLHLFERLEAGDICFYDGSHCVRTGGDVNWFLFEVLPRLSPGVLVHLHDIFFPDDYHDDWIFNEGLSWNEQYILQAFLMHNDAYRVVIANHMLWRERPADMAALYDVDGGSIWLEKLR
jgi:hypothetical protein